MRKIRNAFLTIDVLIILSCTALISASSSWELSGDPVVVVTGDKATLRCNITEPDDSGDADVLRVWKDSQDEILFFNERLVQADKERMSESGSNTTMTMFIKDVTLADESTYKCGLNGITPPQYKPIQLTVNQYPQQVYITNSGIEPVEGVEETVMTCHVKGVKPKPAVWFTDADGNKVDNSASMEVIADHEHGVMDVSLSLTSTFSKNDDNTVYKCNIQRADGTTETAESSPVRVRYEATASLERAYNGETKVVQEDERLQVLCSTIGYPAATATWTFQPGQNTNITTENYWPDNFMRSADGKTLIANRLQVSDGTSTNNGTFTCTASNGIGSPSILSFDLQVYAMPVTTVQTTPDVTTKLREATVAAPLSAGSDGAVIGGVVAVAAFVLIVAVILIARYFMSHKGTYHTNEMKSREVDEEKAGDDRLMDHDDEDDDDFSDLHTKKRTEYFM